MLTAPGDSFLQGIPGTAGPEDELVAGSFLIDQILYQRLVWFAEFRPLAEAEGSVKVYGDDLICCQTVGTFIYHIPGVFKRLTCAKLAKRKKRTR